MTKQLKITGAFALATFLLLFNYSCTPDTAPPAVSFKNKDNTVLVRLPAEPDRLNPILTTSAYARYIHRNIFLQLINYDPVTLTEKPALAKAAPTTEVVVDSEGNEGIAYTYEIFDQARWSDGQPVNAADVVFTFKALMNVNVGPSAPYRPFFAFISDIVIDPDNPKKFTVFTNETYILAEPSISSVSILPVHVFDPEGLMADVSLADIINDAEKTGAKDNMIAFADLFTSAPYSRDGDKFVGSGAYQLDAWEAGQYISISKIDDWWAKDGAQDLVARPDSMVFKIIGENTVAIGAFKEESIDVSAQVDSEDFMKLQEEPFMKAHYNFYTPDTYSYYYIAFNNANPKLSDKRVRRAMTHLLDVEELIATEFAGLATPMNNTPVSPSKSYYDKSLKPIPFDVGQAKALLKQAGWQDSNANGTVDKEIDGQLVEMELEYLVTPGAKFANAMANILKDNAIEAGVKININQMDIRTILGERVAARDYDLFGLGASGDNIPDDFTQLWHTSSNTPRGGNRTQFGNAETDALIEKINRTLDETERDALYKEFQRIVYDEQPMIFLFVPQERIIVSKRFDAVTTSLRPGFYPEYFKNMQ